ncbi:MAG: MFS transporter [Polyangiaceae bacterium]
MPSYSSLPKWAQELIPILVLLGVIAFVLRRLPKVEVGHTKGFLRRRLWNWLPAGLTYAFLYMGRYNLTAFKNAAHLTNDAYGTIDFWGAIVYGFAFVINGPLADKIGGRKTLLIAAVGSAAMNVVLGVLALKPFEPSSVASFSIAYAANMYFQSFGAVSIVKVNAAWFHIRERGTFGGIFGILISLGVYFAYDWGPKIADAFPGQPQWVFFIPPIALLVLAAVDFALVRDTPGEAGQRDFDPGDATVEGEKLSVLQVARRMLTSKVILIIAVIEFCSGYLRNAVMKWGPVFAKETGVKKDQFVHANWGMMNCIAGILGGMFAGVISDHVFGSRRGPVSSILYLGMLGGAVGMCYTLTNGGLGWALIFASLCVIGVHGMLSGTASMDFGGKKNVGVAVGIIDGFVYLGTAVQALVLKELVPSGDAQKDPTNWWKWPIAMVPLMFVGLLLALRLWDARATRGGAH